MTGSKKYQELSNRTKLGHVYLWIGLFGCKKCNVIAQMLQINIFYDTIY